MNRNKITNLLIQYYEYFNTEMDLTRFGPAGLEQGETAIKPERDREGLTGLWYGLISSINMAVYA